MDLIKILNHNNNIEIEEGTILFFQRNLVVNEIIIEFICIECPDNKIIRIVFKDCFVENYSEPTICLIKHNRSDFGILTEFIGYANDKVSINSKSFFCALIDTQNSLTQAINHQT